VGGPWSAQFASAIAESSPCWLEVRDSNDRLLMVMDGGFDRMVVLGSCVDLDGIFDADGV
jgi:hypothetical protein